MLKPIWRSIITTILILTTGVAAPLAADDRSSFPSTCSLAIPPRPRVESRPTASGSPT